VAVPAVIAKRIIRAVLIGAAVFSGTAVLVSLTGRVKSLGSECGERGIRPSGVLARRWRAGGRDVAAIGAVIRGAVASAAIARV